MSYNLFLDDERSPKDVTWCDLPLVEWYIVRSYNEFVNAITNSGLPVHVSFDHDLADQHYPNNPDGAACKYEAFKEKTGYHCAKWLAEYCLENCESLPEYTIHSKNPIGVANIESVLSSFKKFYDGNIKQT